MLLARPPNINGIYMVLQYCYNNKCKLDKWRQSECNLHPGTTKGLCPCPEPFRLFCFPGPKLYKDRRDRWVKLMRRTTVDNAMWIPKPSDRVCSNHFVDKEPTPDHPDPTIQLGYDFVPTQRRRELFRQPVAKKRKNLSLSDDETVPFLVDSSNLTSPSPAIPPQSVLHRHYFLQHLQNIAIVCLLTKRNVLLVRIKQML